MFRILLCPPRGRQEEELGAGGFYVWFVFLELKIFRLTRYSVFGRRA